MLTALVTITRSPRLEVLGNTLGPQASRVEHPIRVDHGHVDVAHAVDVPRLHLDDHGLALAQHGPAGRGTVQSEFPDRPTRLGPNLNGGPRTCRHGTRGAWYQELSCADDG